MPRNCFIVGSLTRPTPVIFAVVVSLLIHVLAIIWAKRPSQQTSAGSEIGIAVNLLRITAPSVEPIPAPRLLDAALETNTGPELAASPNPGIVNDAVLVPSRAPPAQAKVQTVEPSASRATVSKLARPLGAPPKSSFGVPPGAIPPARKPDSSSRETAKTKRSIRETGKREKFAKLSPSAIAKHSQPPVAVAPAPQPAVLSSAPDRAAQRDYLSRLSNLVNAQLRYPRRAKQRGQQGVVKIEFVVDASGHVSNAGLSGGVSSPLLQRAALNALKRATPFPPPPPSLVHGNLRMTLPVRFVLDDGA